MVATLKYSAFLQMFRLKIGSPIPSVGFPPSGGEAKGEPVAPPGWNEVAQFSDNIEPNDIGYQYWVSILGVNFGIAGHHDWH
jgi:hypothetical protein